MKYYRIAWKNEITHKYSYGKWQKDLKIVNAWVDHFKKNPIENFKHWIQEK